RALGFAIRIAAVQATPGLEGGLGLPELAVQLVPVALGAQLQRHLARHLARDVEELEDFFLAHARGFGIGDWGFGTARPRRLRAAARIGNPRFRIPNPEFPIPALMPPSAARSPAPRGSRPWA